MVERGRAKRVDPAEAHRYRTVGEALLRSAGAMVELSDLDWYYGNAIAIVSSHAVIAYNDALAVAFHGVKSTEGEHVRAADLLQSALGPRALRPLTCDLGTAYRATWPNSWARRTRTPASEPACSSV